MSLEHILAEKAEAIVKPKYLSLNDKWAHGWPHIKRVAHVSEKLAIKVGVDPVACIIAAYCHDLGTFEEKSYGEGRELGNTDHSLWSIGPTIQLLEDIGVTGYEKGAIVAAVANHSFKNYQGKDIIGSVLRDADKSDALGPWGTLRCSRHHFKKDLAGTEKILKYSDNMENIKNLAWITFYEIKKREDKLKYLENLTFVLEWDELKMFHHKEIYDLIRDDLEYTKKERIDLMLPEIISAINNSRESERKRSAFFYHKSEYEKTQIGINAIQPKSMIKPHARFTEESLIHLSGELVYIEFDHNGKILRKEYLNEKNTHIRVPSKIFFTVYASENNSALSMLVQGPTDPKNYRIDANWAPSEDESNRIWYDSLKV